MGCVETYPESWSIIEGQEFHAFTFTLNMSIKRNQEEIVSRFKTMGDWLDRYQYLIEVGKMHPPLDERYKTEDYQLEGCQSQVWMKGQCINGLLHIDADSDSMITRGILALLLNAVNDHPPKEIADADFSFLQTIGLSTNLSPSRANGLALMVRRLKRLGEETAENYPHTGRLPR